ncbi:MAG: hypothetical protein H0U16_11585 [Actinobacteria bacterium]|nr:hypothetical protein [Actinomycetota bacterium]
MAALDSEVLRTDPGVIGLGNSSEQALAEARNSPEGPACQASLSAFRVALTFKTIFTAVMAVLAIVALGAVVFVLARTLWDSTWDATNSLAAITAAVTGSGAVFLETLRRKQQKVLDDAMDDVGAYCGPGIQEQLK